MNEQMQISALKAIIRRGKKAFIGTSLPILLLAVIIAFALPPIYLSQSTILIEGQQIPEEYVQSTITGYVEERIHMITQQIMSRTRLMEIVNQFNLYPDLKAKYTTGDIIQKMREDIELETISADVMDKKSGRATTATIAFNLSYEGKNPPIVQKVANRLASLYLEQNLKTREQQASETTDFLQQELDHLKNKIDDIQSNISAFKKVHAGELPEHNQINLQAVSRLEREFEQTDMQIRSLKERLIYLRGQIAGVDPLTPVMTEDGKTMMHPKERLKSLRMELITLQSTLSEKHPDIKKLKREIEKLEARTGDADDSVAKVRRLNDLQGRLATLKGKLGPKHPDVTKLSKEIELLSKEVDKLQTEKTTLEVAEGKPDNPAYINLKTQIASAEIEIQSLIKEKKKVKEKTDAYLKKIENSPLVEKEYNDLIRDYENAKYKYNEIMNKLMEAKIAQGMEESQRGERFNIIDPAELPEKPYKPNRLAIILIGFVLAMGAGVGIAAIQESVNTAVKTEDEITKITGVPLFSTISMIETDQEKKAKQTKRWLWVLAGIGAIILALVFINYFVMPLDIAWIKIQKRLMIL